MDASISRRGRPGGFGDRRSVFRNAVDRKLTCVERGTWVDQCLKVEPPTFSGQRVCFPAALTDTANRTRRYAADIRGGVQRGHILPEENASMNVILRKITDRMRGDLERDDSSRTQYSTLGTLAVCRLMREMGHGLPPYDIRMLLQDFQPVYFAYKPRGKPCVVLCTVDIGGQLCLEMSIGGS